MTNIRVTIQSADETRHLGRRLGQAAQPGDVFLLEGSFGAGKTVLVQGLAEGLGVQGPVASPSFVIVTQHRGRLTLYHVDLYRVERPDPDLLQALDEQMADRAVTAIEWAEHLTSELRRGATLIRLTPAGDDQRTVEIDTPHQRLAQAAKRER